jgi:hypothetical protein
MNQEIFLELWDSIAEEEILSFFVHYKREIHHQISLKLLNIYKTTHHIREWECIWKKKENITNCEDVIVTSLWVSHFRFLKSLEISIGNMWKMNCFVCMIRKELIHISQTFVFQVDNIFEIFCVFSFKNSEDQKFCSKHCDNKWQYHSHTNETLRDSSSRNEI